MHVYWNQLKPEYQEILIKREHGQDAALPQNANVKKARVYYRDHVVHYEDQKLALRVWLNLPKGVRAAFRGADDARPVYSHDLVDRL